MKISGFRSRARRAGPTTSFAALPTGMARWNSISAANASQCARRLIIRLMASWASPIYARARNSGRSARRACCMCCCADPANELAAKGVPPRNPQSGLRVSVSRFPGRRPPAANVFAECLLPQQYVILKEALHARDVSADRVGARPAMPLAGIDFHLDRLPGAAQRFLQGCRLLFGHDVINLALQQQDWRLETLGMEEGRPGAVAFGSLRQRPDDALQIVR